MLIGELAKASNVSIRSIRYYENKGLIRSQRLGNGYRVYQEDAVPRVRIIKTCLALGFSVKEVVSILACMVNDGEALPRCEAVMAMYSNRLVVVEEQIASLSLVRELLQASLGRVKA